METDEEILLDDLNGSAVRHPVDWKPAPQALIDFFKQHDVPEEFVDLYKEHCPVSYAQLGTAGLHDMERIFRDHAEHSELIGSGLLSIGSTSCGDFVVMDIREHIGAIGYVTHEQLCQPDPIDNARPYYRLVSPTLGMFVRGLLRNAVPMDYHWTWCEDDDEDDYSVTYSDSLLHRIVQPFVRIGSLFGHGRLRRVR